MQTSTCDSEASDLVQPVGSVGEGYSNKLLTNSHKPDAMSSHCRMVVTMVWPAGGVWGCTTWMSLDVSVCVQLVNWYSGVWVY